MKGMKGCGGKKGGHQPNRYATKGSKVGTARYSGSRGGYQRTGGGGRGGSRQR